MELVAANPTVRRVPTHCTDSFALAGIKVKLFSDAQDVPVEVALEGISTETASQVSPPPLQDALNWT